LVFSAIEAPPAAGDHVMYFRFGSALFLVVLVAMAGVALEKRTLELRRSVSRQHYQTDVLQDAYSRARLRTQQLGAPERVIDALDAGEMELNAPTQPADKDEPQIPLLQWQRAAPVGR
jgi:hypothetical protein